MSEVFFSEVRRYRRGSLVLVGVFALLSAMYFSMFPEFADEAEEVAELFPEAIFDMFGITALHTIEGFIAAEIYAFFWVVLLGIYFAYTAAGSIAGDIETRKLDLTLTNPISRESVMAQKIAALIVPLAILNLTVPVIVYVGGVLIDEPINPVAIVMVHLLSVPYLLACAGVGMVLSVMFDRKRTPQAIALGLVFVLWLVEAASNMDDDLEWVGYFTPARYYDPTAILVDEEYAMFDAGVALLMFAVLVLVAVALFLRRDI